MRGNNDIFIQSIAIAKNSKSLILAVHNVAEELGIKEYELFSQRFIRDLSVISDRYWGVQYILSDQEQIIINHGNKWKKYFLYYLNDLVSNSPKELAVFEYEKYFIDWFVLESQNLAVSSERNNLVKVWNIQTGQCIDEFLLDDYAENVLLLNSQIVVGWNSSPNLWAWCLNTHQFLLRIDNVSPQAVKYNPDNQSILVGLNNGEVACYSLNNQELIWKTKVYELIRKNKIYKGSVYDIEIFPETSIIVTCGTGGELAVIDVNSGKIKSRIKGHEYNGYWLLKLPNNGLIVQGSDVNIRIWDIETKECIAVLSGHLYRIKDIKMSPDHQYLVSRDEMERAIVWKADWNNFVSNVRQSK